MHIPFRTEPAYQIIVRHAAGKVTVQQSSLRGAVSWCLRYLADMQPAERPLSLEIRCTRTGALRHRLIVPGSGPIRIEDFPPV